MAAADLLDVRAKISGLADAVLGAVAAATGRDKSEIVRDLLQEWAERQVLQAQYIFGAIEGLEPLTLDGQKARPRRQALPTAVRVEIYDRDGGQCSYCGCAVDRGGVWHVDHVVPVSKGGTNEPDNLRLACPACNLKKAANSAASVMRAAANG